MALYTNYDHLDDADEPLEVKPLNGIRFTPEEFRTLLGTFGRGFTDQRNHSVFFGSRGVLSCSREQIPEMYIPDLPPEFTIHLPV